MQAVWRIPSNEIDRPGSFASHMSRCVLLLVEILRHTRDHKMLFDLALRLRDTPESDKWVNIVNILLLKCDCKVRFHNASASNLFSNISSFHSKIFFRNHSLKVARRVSICLPQRFHPSKVYTNILKYIITSILGLPCGCMHSIPPKLRHINWWTLPPSTIHPATYIKSPVNYPKHLLSTIKVFETYICDHSFIDLLSNFLSHMNDVLI